MNILEIIKKAPEDHVYWCTLIGECKVKIDDIGETYPLRVETGNDFCLIMADGRYFENCDGECVLFPSKDNRDWAAFERELDGKPEEKKPLFYSENESFDGSIEMVSIPDRPMMAAVICAGLLAGGCKESAGVLASKAVHYADIILKHRRKRAMTKEQIEKAVDEYIGYPPEMDEGIETTMRRNAFKDGAYWRINSVWHKPEEVPEAGKDCLVEYVDGDGCVHIRIDRRSEYEWVEACHYDRILRWAYLDDLIPTEDETA